MKQRELLANAKREAIAQVERLGHKLGPFEKFKVDEIYYSSFCARCSAYLRIDASGGTGRAAEQACQRLCSCKRPLGPDDLDGNCIACRGSKLTLYQKTPVVRARDERFKGYCRRKDREYEPSPETLSQYFWRCQRCAKRLGDGYQGEPDERGFCADCATSEQAYERRREGAIAAAGGPKMWRRKRLIRKALIPFDYIAIFIIFLFIFAIVLCAVRAAAIEIWKELFRMWSDANDWIILIVCAASATWCAVRWKAINARPSDSEF